MARYFIIEGGPLLPIAEKYRTDYIQARRGIKEWSERHDIEAVGLDFEGRIYRVKFKGHPPRGFKKMNRYGMTEPYKRNAEWQERLNAAPKLPDFPGKVYDYVKLPAHVKYTPEGGGEGMWLVALPGMLEPAAIYWFSADGPMALVTADIEEMVLELQHRGDTVEPPEFSYPEGLKPSFKEEWEYLAAVHKNKT